MNANKKIRAETIQECAKVVADLEYEGQRTLIEQSLIIEAEHALLALADYDSTSPSPTQVIKGVEAAIWNDAIGKCIASVEEWTKTIVKIGRPDLGWVGVDVRLRLSALKLKGDDK